MANMIKLESSRMSGRKVSEDKHNELLKVLNEMTMNKRLKYLRGEDITVDSVLIALEYYDEVRVRKGDTYIRICKPINCKYVWYVNSYKYGFNATSINKGTIKDKWDRVISNNYTGEQQWHQVLEDLLK